MAGTAARRIDGARWIAVAVLAALAPTVGLAAEGAAEAQGARHEAVQQVERLHATLIEMMKRGDALGFEARRERIDAIVESTFDVGAISRISLGRHWRGLGEEERRRVTNAIEALITATYAGRFERYSGQRFETLGSGDAPPGQYLVRTRLIPPDDEPISLDYQLRDSGGGKPRIFNVIADGVSDLSMRRAEYSAVFEREGLDGLLRQLRETIRQQREGGDEQAS